jgi:hypothetical protein
MLLLEVLTSMLAAPCTTLEAMFLHVPVPWRNCRWLQHRVSQVYELACDAVAPDDLCCSLVRACSQMNAVNLSWKSCSNLVVLSEAQTQDP